MTSTPPAGASDADPSRADVGIIGGSGLYALIDGLTEVPVETPYGLPSEPPLVGSVGDRRVAFIPRHGKDHRFPPHKVPYRANLWALRSLGVRQVLAPSAVGSLRADLGPGTLVVPDQVVDRTTGRALTYYDEGAVHVSFADPYCPTGRRTVLHSAAHAGWSPTEGGTLVVISGPRFSSRAESKSYAAAGWSIVGMTGLPEAALARELALCYTTVALVTDLDAGVETGDGVTHAEVLKVFGREVARLRDLLIEVVTALPTEDELTCPCRSALDGLHLPFTLP
jgi:5'-methylthioadenosine phosphorylase